ncbi:MAG: hypothetical protein LBI44_02425 [Oscillospiraceae bacterium]|jgi:hypothetical protein|nr:hypothetical protein [Oscillospiraceae bacterium]
MIKDYSHVIADDGEKRIIGVLVDSEGQHNGERVFWIECDETNDVFSFLESQVIECPRCKGGRLTWKQCAAKVAAMTG